MKIYILLGLAIIALIVGQTVSIRNSIDKTKTFDVANPRLGVYRVVKTDCHFILKHNQVVGVYCKVKPRRK